MSLVLPYHDDLAKYGGGFIHPNGQLIPVYGKHERMAKNYCEGMIDSPDSGLKFIYPQIPFYTCSQLTKQQLEIYKLWLKSREKHQEDLYSDFLVLCLGFDKVEIIKTHAITTSNSHPHIRLYNYYLMNWNIDVLPKQLYNPSTKEFESSREISYSGDFLDSKYEEELDEIK